MQQTYNKKEWTTDTNNTDESQDHDVKRKKKPDKKYYLVYGSIFTVF